MSKKYLELIEQNTVVKLKNSTDGYNQKIIIEDFLKFKKSIFVVLPNLYEAQKYYDSLSMLVNSELVLFYPTDQMLTTIMALGSPEFKNERIYTLRKLLSNEPYIVVTTQLGLTRKQLSPSDYKNSSIKLVKGNFYDMKELNIMLVTSGYNHSYLVEKPGDFSVRGGIIDIYPLDQVIPYRLDFFGNELEAIKSFDINSQISNEKYQELQINSINEIFYTDKMRDVVVAKINKHFEKMNLSKSEQQKQTTDIENIMERKKQETLAIYIDFFTKNTSTILDFSPNYHLYFIDLNKMITNDDNLKNDLEMFAYTIGGNAFSSISSQVLFQPILKMPHIEIDNLGINNLDAFDLKIINIPEFSRNLKLMWETIKSYVNKYTINFHIISSDNINDLIEYFDDLQIPYCLDTKKLLSINIIKEYENNSYISVTDKTIVITEQTLFNIKKRTNIRYRSVINQSSRVRNTDDLQIGDYVVHYDYGIGQYLGLKTLGLSGNKRDYLFLRYDADETLYIPVDQIEMVLKYSSYEGHVPKLTKIGSKTWNKTKANARKQVKDLSDKLINLYSKRREALGYSFSPDNEMQQLFESDFLFEETQDQLLAIKHVKQDMESPRPMDRLICGDVGFGKTEVALRAAFKAVLDGKQVAYLVPTTVLARQHYYTFKERFEKYGGSVELLSRFVPRKKQLETIDRIKKGYVDVVIGTHRLLSKDITFNDLGLMIVDEEQRFGVEHKERIKEIKINVDTLTLSATPIPRTLQMSLIGLKDLSMIETPPLNRYPVQTYVVGRNDSLIKEAIWREMSRGGQIYYLYNKVDDIDQIVVKLNKLVPEARVTYAHGQMTRTQLEDVLSDFIDHEYDILVSTTIIETGIDIPNTNTLLIHEADKLGLSQLYQIRGRVGRSDKIAYAYLFYDERKDINDEAWKRLSVIEDFTELGSGYNIALRDLSIRGSGDILGKEQSGFIDSVGIELYMKLLDEAITGIPIQSISNESSDQIFSNRTIDEKYINSDAIRIEIHKKISNQNTISDLEDLELELRDRFGAFDPELIEYMYEKLFNQLTNKLIIEKVIKKAGEVEFIFSKEKTLLIDGVKLFEYVNSQKEFNVKLSYLKGKIHIKLLIDNIHTHWLMHATKWLENLIIKI